MTLRSHPRLRQGPLARRSIPRSGSCAGHLCLRSYPTLKVRNSSGKEIPLLQGKEQRLCFAGAGREKIPHAQGKRNPSKMVGVAREHQRADTLKPYSQKTRQSNHTRTTALSNSMKPSHARRATQDGRVMVERSDRMWSTGEGNGKPLQYSCLENPMNSMNSMK